MSHNKENYRSVLVVFCLLAHFKGEPWKWQTFLFSSPIFLMTTQEQIRREWKGWYWGFKICRVFITIIQKSLLWVFHFILCQFILALSQNKGEHSFVSKKWKVKRDLKIFGQSAPQLNPQPVILSTLKFSAITYSKGLKHGPARPLMKAFQPSVM